MQEEAPGMVFWHNDGWTIFRELETQACGTGACAAVVAGVRNGLLKAGAPVRVTLPGGELFISWEEGGDVQMTGPAETVFEGELQYS